MKKENCSKGFTLMEMLIVVAIIAILIVIAIPSFTNQLEKAREATDLANVRSAYAEVVAAALVNDKNPGNGVTYNADNGTWSKHVDAVQRKKGWQTIGKKSYTETINIADKPLTYSLKGWTVTFYSQDVGTNGADYHAASTVWFEPDL